MGLISAGPLDLATFDGDVTLYEPNFSNLKMILTDP
jgi:hypothetical protein